MRHINQMDKNVLSTSPQRRRTKQFIEISLQDGVTPDVPLEEITILGGEIENGELVFHAGEVFASL